MKKLKGFTLIEMSMVLVLIALIFSLVTYSTSLIKQARVKALITELSQYQQVIQNFAFKYYSLPGDFYNAYNTFGSSCSSVASDCNGNSNGIIEWANTTNTIEALRAWQHLYLAGYITTSYPGTATVMGQSDIGVNIPASSWPSAGIELYVGAVMYAGKNGNALQVAGFTANSSASSANVMTPLDAYTIDLKIDDGVGQTGRVLGLNMGTANSCVGTDNLNYNLTLSNNVCMIRYLLFYTGYF